MSNESLKLWRILLYRTVIRIFYDSFNMTHARSEIIHRTEKPRFFLKFGPVRPFMLEKCSFQFQRKWSIENSKWKLNHVIFENFDVEIPSRINFNTFFQIQNFEIIFRQFLSDHFWKVWKKNRKWFISSFCGHLKNKIQIWQNTKDNFSNCHYKDVLTNR